MRTNAPASARGGFTLLEVVVAVTITAVLAGFIVAILSNVSGFWSRTSGRLSAEAQGRFVLDQVTVDLQSALFRDDGKAWLAATIPTSTANTISLWNSTGVVPAAAKPNNGGGSLLNSATGNLTDARFGITGTWLRFFTMKRGTNPILGNSTTTATSTSAPVAVAYQIVRRGITTNTNSERRYLLHRSEVRPSALSSTQSGTLQAGFDITDEAYQPGTVSTQTGSPGEIRFPTLNSVIAENVIDFGVRMHIHVRNTETGALELQQIFPSANNDTLHVASLPPRSANGDGTFTDCFPEVVDVAVRILTDDGARLIASYERGAVTAPAGRTAQQYWWDLAIANSQVFTRRVILNGQAF